jgi:RNA polymerase sigma-70 factor, ECF subfamily
VTATPDARRQRFEALAGEVLLPLQRYLRRRTEDADDVLSEVLLVLWRRLEDVPDEALPWAYGVARGCLANHRRSAQRRLKLVRRLATERVVEASDDTDLAEALACLREDDREVLRLWAWEQLPPREIAVVLGITPNAASIRLHRATKKLRHQLVGKDAQPSGHKTGRQATEAGT